MPISDESSLTNLSAITGLPSASLRDILNAAGLATKGKQDTTNALRVIIEYFRARAAKNSASRSESKDRKESADADSAEMKALKESREFCFQSDYDNNFKDAIARGVTSIERLDIPDEHKEKVFAALRSVKLPEIEEELES